MMRLTENVARAGMILALSLGTLAACDRLGGDDTRSESGGELDDSFEPTKVEKVKGVPAAAIRSEIVKRLESNRPKPISERQWRHVKRLYAQYQGSPIWLDSDGLRERRTKTLMTALLNADADALALDDYPLDELRRVLAGLLEAKDPQADQLADVDVVITSTYVSLAEDLLLGQVDPRAVSQASQAWNINRPEEQLDTALARILQDRRFDLTVTQMRPEYEEYQALQRQLGRYRQIVARGGWQPIPEGKALKPGDAAPAERLTALRERLRAEGYLGDSVPEQRADSGADSAADTAGREKARSAGKADARANAPAAAGRAVYDRALAGAVAQFQREHGIGVDSALGSETVRSLNLPADYRLGQIAGNMERFRWMPRSMGDRYVFVNVPAFRLEAYDDGKKTMEMKVIVGAEYEDRATPVFSDSMQHVVFRPYWNATDGIMEKELWPAIEKDPTYLDRHAYEIVNEGGKQRIRQRPGDKNALGLVKFMFPNEFDIYMHDTPEDALFDRDVRAFSHGCIRLEKPAEMAQWVLGWPADRVRESMESGPDDRWVKLPKKIPVYIVYFTTFMRDGRLHFGNDLYARDEPLVRAVAKGAQPSVETVRAVKELRELAED